MWLPLVLAVAAAPARPAPKPPTEQVVQPTVVVVVTPPVVEATPAPMATPVEPVVAVTPAAAPIAATAHVKPIAISLDVGVDIPLAQRTPMASARLDLSTRLQLPGAAFATLGIRGGYSFVSGEIGVADPNLGVDQHALLMAHRVPMRAAGRLGLAGDTVAAGVVASVGADVVSVHAQSFGRVADALVVVPGASVGGFVDVALNDTAAVGLLGEYDVAVVDLAALTPGVSGDLSAVRLALFLKLSFG